MHAFQRIQRTPARLALLAALLTGTCGVSAMATADEAPAPATSVSDAQLASAKCPIGMEKFLPAQYFYCLAAQNYGTHHYTYADKFFKEAAAWGSKPAQYVLGVMALNGDQQPVDRPLALAWFTLASERHTARFQQPYDALKKTATPDEQRKADAYLATMRQQYADAVAAPRAEDRYRQGMKLLVGSAAAGTYCMDGVKDFRDSAGSGSGMDEQTSNVGSCGPSEAVAQYIDREAGEVFEDWTGHVTVGAVEAVPAPAAAH